MKFLPALAALLAVALLFPSKTFGAGKKKSPTPEPDTSDHITSVHLTSITISMYATHAAKEYKVTTKITVNALFESVCDFVGGGCDVATGLNAREGRPN